MVATRSFTHQTLKRPAEFPSGIEGQGTGSRWGEKNRRTAEAVSKRGALGGENGLCENSEEFNILKQ